MNYLCKPDTFIINVVHVQAVDNSSVAFVVEAVPQLAAFQRLHNALCQLEVKCAVH